MARKKFRLETVWRLRNLMEEKRKRELGMIQGELVQARKRRQDLVDEMGQEREDLERKMSGGIEARRMQLVQAHLRAMQGRLVLADLAIVDARNRLLAKREELLAATRDRKVMDSLRKKFLARREYEENKEEEKVLAETALNRYLRRANE